MPFHHAATQNTPLKLRTTSVPTTGKIFKAHEVNQDLLVELHDVTLHEDPLSTPHYVLELCDNISPTVIQSLPLQSRTSPLKIKSLKLKYEYLYRNGCWEPMKVPKLLRPPATSSSRHNGWRPCKATGIQNETIQRCISGTLEEMITGTFIPAAGSEEKHAASWLNGITKALQALLPNIILPAPIVPVAHRMTTCSTQPCRFWSLETSCKPIKDGPMSCKPDLVLWEGPSLIGPQPEFSWKDVISFMELMSTSYSDSDSTGTIHNGVTHKAYTIFASQPTRWFLLALSIAQQEFCVHMFDRAGVVHSHAYSIHRSPRVLLCMLAVLTFGQPEHVGFNPTIIYLSPMSQISSNNTIQVSSATYSIIRQIFFNYLICGRGTTCWHVR